MAVDTAQKRLSAMHVGCPWRSVLPIADGDIDAGDRETLLYLYSGLAVTVEPEIPSIPQVGPSWGSGGGGPARGGKRGHVAEPIPYETQRSPYEPERYEKPKPPKFRIKFDKKPKKHHVHDPNLALIDEDLALIDMLRRD